MLCGHCISRVSDGKGREKGEIRTYKVMTSWKSHIPRRVANTPRTADVTMCVMGEVTLMERRAAMLIKNPSVP
jgi:hypothetical protein